MFHEELDNQYIVKVTGTSEGTQVKYKKGDYWYKEDNRGEEGLAEYLSSKLLTFSNLKPEEYILYEQGFVNEKKACRSKNFLNDGESLVTLYRLYFNETGRNLAEVIASIDEMEERVLYVLRFVQRER